MNTPVPSSARSIAVVRALPGLGDFLCAVPALRALRDAFPDARISLVGLPAAATYASAFPGYIDEFLEFPGHPGIPEVPLVAGAREAFERQAQARAFDLAVQMHGNGALMNGFLPLTGAPAVLGYRLPCAPPTPGLVPASVGVPEVRRWTQLVERLGAIGDERLEYPVQERDAEEAEELLAARRIRPPYACVHPGAASRERRWPASGFAAAARLAASRGLAVVVTGSPAEDALCAEVVAASGGRATSVCGATRTGVLAAIVAGAALVVCNDTGISHLAQAVGTRSVTVFTGATDPARWAPLDADVHIAVGPPPPEAAEPASAAPADPAALPAECGGAPCPVLAERPRRAREVPEAVVLGAVSSALDRIAKERSSDVA